MLVPYQSSPRNRSASRAFSLVEVTLALGVAAFCLTTLMGLIPVGLTSNQASIEQTTAASVASRVVSDLRCAITSGSSNLGFVFPSGAAAASASPQVLYFTETGNPIKTAQNSSAFLSGTTARYRADVGFCNTSSPAQGATMVRILVTWPGVSDSANTSWANNYQGSFESVTALNLTP